MIVIEFNPPRTINAQALTAALKQIAPDCAGVSIVGDVISNHRVAAQRLEIVLPGAPPPNINAALRDAVTAHNAATLTAEQEAQDEGEADRDALRQAKAAAALDQLADDLAAVDTADVAALRAILRRTLQRQRGIIKALRQVV